LSGYEVLELRPLLTIQMRPNRQHVGGDAVVDGHVGLPERVELLGELLFGRVVGLEQIGQFQLFNLPPALKLSHVPGKGLALGPDDGGGFALQPQPPDQHAGAVSAGAGPGLLSAWPSGLADSDRHEVRSHGNGHRRRQ